MLKKNNATRIEDFQVEQYSKNDYYPKPAKLCIKPRKALLLKINKTYIPILSDEVEIKLQLPSKKEVIVIKAIGWNNTVVKKFNHAPFVNKLITPKSKGIKTIKSLNNKKWSPKLNWQPKLKPIENINVNLNASIIQTPSLKIKNIQNQIKIDWENLNQELEKSYKHGQ